MSVRNAHMRTYLFINPGSGRYSSGNFRNITARLGSFGCTPEIFQVRSPDDVFSRCKAVNQNPEPCLVIVAAGDGTFNAVVNGLRPGTATVAILPCGTSNVLASEIGIQSVEDGISRIAAGKTKSLSVGLLELKDSSHRFVLMAGIGLDGAVVRDVNPLAKRFLRQGAYGLSALRRSFAWDTTLFNITCSEENIRCHSAIICNASRYGGDFVLAPESSPFSQGLTAICVTGHQRRTYLGIVRDLFRGTIETNRNLARRSAAHIIIDGTQPIQIDGDFIGYGPAQITEISDFARIIV